MVISDNFDLGVASTSTGSHITSINDEQLLNWLTSRKLSSTLCNVMVELNTTIMACK